MKIAASIVDHPLSRIALGLFGVVVTALFGLFSVILLMSNPFQEPATFATGLGACLGMVGWWVRLFVRPPTLARLTWLRLTLCVCLVAGIIAASHALPFVPIAAPGFPLLVATIAAGTLLLLGTLGRSGPGPNNSFKPKPLRGSA